MEPETKVMQVRVNWSATDDGGYADVFTVGDFFDSKIFHSSFLTGKIVDEIIINHDPIKGEYALIIMTDGTVIKQYNINGVVYGKQRAEGDS